MSRAAARGGRVERLPQPITLDQFELGVTLGTGSFGRVRFVVHKVSFLFTNTQPNAGTVPKFE
jgi:hypothetical protein